MDMLKLQNLHQYGREVSEVRYFAMITPYTKFKQNNDYIDATRPLHAYLRRHVSVSRIYILTWLRSCTTRIFPINEFLPHIFHTLKDASYKRNSTIFSGSQYIVYFLQKVYIYIYQIFLSRVSLQQDVTTCMSEVCKFNV